MPEVIAITNQKGGVGKTTTSAALIASLYERGKKVLAIDLDPQGNLGFSLGVDIENTHTLYEVFKKQISIEQAICKTEYCDLLASNILLSGVELEFNKAGREYMLKSELNHISKNYDYIIIDTPPALGILTVNALTACDSVIIPAQADIYSLQGIEQLSKTIQPIKKYCNDKLKIDGILLTRYSPRAILSREVAEIANDLAQNLNTKVFKSTIREAIAVKESQINKQSLFDYAPNSNVTNDYLNFINELLEGEL